jgi:hypothetical protein
MGLHGMPCLLIFSGGEDYAGLDRIPVCCCVIGERIVRGRGARVNGSGCAWFRKTVQKFFVWIEAPKKGPHIIFWVRLGATRKRRDNAEALRTRSSAEKEKRAHGVRPWKNN